MADITVKDTGLRGVVAQTLKQGVYNLAAGGAIVVDARGMERLTMRAPTGTTITFSEVDSPDATAHGQNSKTVDGSAAAARSTQTVEWPFYRISAAGGPASVALV